MDTELRQLGFSAGGKEQLMLEKIKSLAVTVLNPSVYIVSLHGMKQLQIESVKSFIHPPISSKLLQSSTRGTYPDVGRVYVPC